MTLKLSENALRVLEARYLRRDAQRRIVETPEQLFERVARAIAHAELLLGNARQAAYWQDEFYKLLVSLEFIPNSPTLMNAGVPLGQLSACFVLPVEDTMEGIFEAIKQMALVQRTGGGTGFSFSKLRPKGDVVASTGGEASGPVSFMKIFDCVTEYIKQGGKRRGANMGVLRVDHPDILELITAKLDGTSLQNFNISIGVTDAFLKAVQQDQRYDLIHPGTGKPVSQLRAKQVFDTIVEAAWRVGDPGLLFLDTINRANPTPHLGSIEATNPCVTGDTWVHTNKGPRQVQNLLHTPFTAVVHGKEYRATAFRCTGEKPVFRIKTDRGFSLRLTASHQVKVERWRRRSRGGSYWVEIEWRETKDLRPGDRIVLHNHRGYTWDGEGTFMEGWLVGQMVGDGGYNPEKYRDYIRFWGDTKAYMAEIATSAIRHLPYRVRADFTGRKFGADAGTLTVAATALDQLAKRYITPANKGLLPAIEEASSDFYCGFLRGLFDTDGSVQRSKEKGLSVRLTQSALERLRVVQRMLARLGILSTIYRNRKPRKLTMLPDGKGGRKLYLAQNFYELVITKDNIVEFDRRVGFSDPAKQEALKEALRSLSRGPSHERFTAQVTAVLPDGVEDVYDCTVEEVHAFDANGIVAHNCGEVPLLPYEACNLGSINLARMVLEHNGHVEVDWVKLLDTVRKAVRFLDDVIEVNKYPVPEIEHMTRGNRKIGLGIMGFAELLIRLNISYDSDEAVGLAERIMHAIASEALKVSQELAKERGVFPNWKGSIYESRGIKVRNATCTAIAPTGTLSILANTSASIEPLFALAYQRKHVLGDQTLREINPIFLEYLQRYGLNVEEIVEKILEKGRLKDIEKVPEGFRRLFTTALEIPPERHLQIQAAFQRHVDNSVSKTINLPQDATPQDVARAYWQAWELGLKGITIYRYGSKSAQVLELGVDEKAHHYDHASKCDPEECRV